MLGPSCFKEAKEKKFESIYRHILVPLNHLNCACDFFLILFHFWNREIFFDGNGIRTKLD